MVSRLSELHSSRSVPVVSPLPGDWSCCCRRVPQSAPEGLFLFEKFLLLNPAAPYKEGPVLSHSPPLQLYWDCLGHGSTRPNSQLSWAGAHCLLVFTTLLPYSPLCDLKQPGLSQCCSSLVWQGRESLTRLSPRSPGAGPAGRGPGAVVALFPMLVPGTFLS